MSDAAGRIRELETGLKKLRDILAGIEKEYVKREVALKACAISSSAFDDFGDCDVSAECIKSGEYDECFPECDDEAALARAEQLNREGKL